MTDIRGCPNPLLQAFSDKYGLGVVFDANNVPTFNGNKVPLAEFKAFFETAGAGEDEGAAGGGGGEHSNPMTRLQGVNSRSKRDGGKPQ